jgi:hypothetical protein
MLERRASKVGRPREVKGVGKPIMLYLDDARVSDFRRLCESEYNISVSEGIRQLMEQELEKNEVGQINPTNIQYGLRNKLVINNTIMLTLDDFPIKSKNVKTIVDRIPTEKLPIAFAISRKLNQQIQFRQNGKITI